MEPAGQCTIEGGTLSWANGSSLTDWSFYGPGGALCGSADISLDGQSVTYRNPAGQQWVMVEDGDDQAITCPNGEEVTLTAAQGNAFEECNGEDGSNAGACITRNDLGGGSCSSSSDCGAGQVCCDVVEGVSMCLIEQACPNQ